MDTVIPITFLKLKNKKNTLDFPVDQESALQCKGHWFNSWSGKIPCCEATNHMCHNCWAQALEPTSLNNYNLCA